MRLAGRIPVTFGLLGASLGLIACEKDQFKGAEAEVGKEKIDPDLPAVPEFQLPSTLPDGSHTVKEMRIMGRSMIDTENLSITGYVTWIYDCHAQLIADGKTEEEAKLAIETTPHLSCHWPQFRIADTPDAGEEATIKVVDVPRYMTKTEKEVYKKPEDIPPDFLRPVPPVAVGDQVVVTGSWKQKGGHGDSNMSGILVYGSARFLNKEWSTETATLAANDKKGKKGR